MKPMKKPAGAVVLAGGGWIATGKPVHVTEPIASGPGCCGALMPLPWSALHLVCSRELEHPADWHVTGISDHDVVAVWPVSS